MKRRRFLKLSAGAVAAAAIPVAIAKYEPIAYPSLQDSRDLLMEWAREHCSIQCDEAWANVTYGDVPEWSSFQGKQAPDWYKQFTNDALNRRRTQILIDMMAS